ELCKCRDSLSYVSPLWDEMDAFPLLEEVVTHFMANSSHEEQAIMEERVGEATTGSEHFTVIGRQLQVGDPAPDFCLDFLDLADLIVRTISLADSTGMVRLLSVVNSLGHPICQRVTQRWEAYRATLPSDACIYTVSRDSPQMQAKFQETTGVLHQALSAHRSEPFGQAY